MTEYRTELVPTNGSVVSTNPDEIALDKPKTERYHAPNEHKPFSYEPVCVGCRESSPMIFKANCEGCRERSRLLAKQKGK